MRRVCTVFLVLFLVAGCSRDHAENEAAETRTDTAVADTGTSTIASPPQVDNPASRPSGSTKATETVQLTEYSILMPPTLVAGPQTLTIVNGGKEMHSFQIEGNGVQARLPADLPRGDSSTIDVNLKPGTYTVWCPVDGHKGKGMTTTVTVQ